MNKVYFLLLLSVLGISTNLTAQSVYLMNNQTVSDTVGYLYDIGDSTSNYFPNQNAKFVINVGAGKNLKLQWFQFDVETNEAGLSQACVYDYLEIYDGDSSVTNLIGRYCGSSPPATFTAVNGKITLIFVSDGGTEGAGFKAYWTTGDLLIINPPTPTTQTYCSASGDACIDTQFHILEVGLGNKVYVNNICNDDSTSLLAYSNYTDSIFLAEASSPILGTASATEFFAGEPQVDIYVDWNNNGNLEDVGESTTAINDGLGGYNYVLIPPAGMQQGLKRMRVRVWYPIVEIVPIGACGQSTWGEVEDYSIMYTDPANPIPQCASGFSPQNNAVNVCTNATFTWASTTDASFYKVSLFDSTNTVLLVQDSIVSSPEIDLSKFLAANTNYKLVVIPGNDNGSASNCDSVSFTTALNMAPALLIDFPLDTALVCNASDLVLNSTTTGGTGTLAYRWLGQNLNYLSDTLSSVATFKSTSIAATSNSYYLLVSDDKGCKSVDSLVVNSLVNPDTATITSAKLSFCAGDSSLLWIKSTEDYVLQDSNSVHTWQDLTLQSLATDTFTTGAISNSTAYRVVTTNGSCQTISKSLLILVNELPVEPTVSSFAGNSICNGDSAILVASPYTTNLLWSTGVANDSITVKVAGAYTVSYTDGNGCKSNSSSFNLVVNVKPTAPTITASKLSACIGDSILLSATGTDIAWDDASSTQGNNLVVYSPGTYSATTTNASSCSTSSQAITLVFNALPSKPTVTVLNGLVSCSNRPTQLVSSNSSGNLWNDNLENQSDTLTVLVSGVYVLKYTDTNGCANFSDSLDVVITISPEQALVEQRGDSLVAKSFGTAYIYTWFNLAGDTIQSGLDSALAAPKGGDTYFLIVKSPAGCESVASNQVRFSSTGIGQLKAEKLQVYPNPSKGEVSILNPFQQASVLRVYDLNGRELLVIDLFNGQNILHLNIASGAYLLTVLNDVGVYRTTLIIQ